ncbi:MAG: flagellin [Pseudomonadota bacterium]
MASINFNQSAVIALDTLRDINMNLQKVQNIISTGKEVANARDNAAVWAISTVMETDVSSFDAIQDSLNLGAATAGVARSASEQVTSLLQEMKTLIVSAQEDNVDRNKIQTDVLALKEQIDSIVNAAQFNGLNLLKGGGNIKILSSLDRDTSGTVTDAEITVNRFSLETGAQSFNAAGADVANVAATGTGSVADGAAATVTFATTATVAEGDGFRVTIGGVNYDYVARDGDNANDVVRNLSSIITAGVAAASQDIDVAITTQSDPSAAAVTLVVTNNTGSAVNIAYADGATSTVGGGLGNLDGIDVSTEQGATDALDNIEGLLQVAINASASFGSAQNRIDIQNDFIESLTSSLEAGISALTDANLEEASARLQSLQVQQQLNIQALTIANQSPQAILALFR